MITYGVRISKVILSARSTNDSIHIGRILSNTFEKGRAGGHKSLAGGQIPFEEIDCENGHDAMEKMASILKNAFGGEME